MYLEYWGLQEKPFENTPDPRFFYTSSEHREALKRLLYAIEEKKGCALLTGEYGCGKTMITRTLISKLDSDRYDLALINYPMFGANEFFREILVQYGQTVTEKSSLALYHQLSQYAFDNVSKGMLSFIIIDEAQLISEPQVFEEIRLLLNLQMEDGFLVHFLLVGQPELRENIMRFPQLEQRISIKYHLHHLSHDDTLGYIRHRLNIAGASRELFTEGAYEIIHNSSFGVARRINNLCDLCLLEGFQTNAEVVNEDIVNRVL